jgi:CRP-like cAMP-binding protein
MKFSKKSCDLASCSMCLACKPEWLPAIDAHRKMIEYKKGELLFKENDPVKGMFFIHKGLVKVHKHWSDGKELIFRFAKDGAIAGHRGLGTDFIYPVSATALQPSSVCFVELDFFIATLKTNPDYLLELMMFFAAELKESENRMRNLAHMNTKGRIADALLRLLKIFGTDSSGFIDISIARQDMAAYTGTTYETLFKIMNELAEDGLIESDGKKMKVLLENGLKRLVV